MKKIILSTLIALSFSLASAQYSGVQQVNGGFDGPSLSGTPITVKQALTLRDDAHVTLRGKITQHLNKDKYLFTDSTGSITVEIDDDEWNGIRVNANDTVELYGEIDKDWNSIELDVDRLTKI